MGKSKGENVSLQLVGGAKPKLKRMRKLVTDAQVGRFFETLAETCNVAQSCRVAGISTHWCYARRKDDATFRKQWGEALAEGYAKLELALLERALAGSVKETEVIDRKGGDTVSTKTTKVTEYPNALAMSLLKMHRDTVREVEGEEPDAQEIEEARERILMKLERLAARAKADDAEA